MVHVVYPILALAVLGLSGCQSIGDKAATAAAPQWPYEYGMGTLDPIVKSGKLTRPELNSLWGPALIQWDYSAKTEMVQYLIEQVGVNVTSPRNFDATPLMLACRNPHNGPEIFRLLLDEGADVHTRLNPVTKHRHLESRYRRMAGSTALHFCAGEALP